MLQLHCNACRAGCPPVWLELRTRLLVLAHKFAPVKLLLAVFQKLRVSFVRVNDGIFVCLGGDAWHELRVAAAVLANCSTVQRMIVHQLQALGPFAAAELQRGTSARVSQNKLNKENKAETKQKQSRNGEVVGGEGGAGQQRLNAHKHSQSQFSFSPRTCSASAVKCCTMPRIPFSHTLRFSNSASELVADSTSAFLSLMSSEVKPS